MNKILITGSAGFIGENLFKYYSKNGYEVFGIDYAYKNSHGNCYKIDINNYSELESKVRILNPDIVINCAARTDLDGKSIEDYSSNTTGVSNLVKICNEFKEKPLLISFSSMLVCRIGHIPKNGEEYSANTPYGKSKIFTEDFTRQYNGAYIIIRPTSVWGPGFKHPYRNFFDIVMASKFYCLPHHKLATKSYSYIDNFIKQIDLIINNKNQFLKDIVYLQDRNPYNIGEWADEILDIMKMRPYTRIPNFVFKMSAKIGDLISKLGLSFPMTTFRYKNMTTNNIIPFDIRFENLEYWEVKRNEASRITINWIKKNQK
jgi:nucleoside-diphosphate-sugar epimerase